MLMEGQILHCRDKSNDAQDNNISQCLNLLAKITLQSITKEHKSNIYYSYIKMEEGNARQLAFTKTYKSSGKPPKLTNRKHQRQKCIFTLISHCARAFCPPPKETCTYSRPQPQAQRLALSPQRLDHLNKIEAKFKSLISLR